MNEPNRAAIWRQKMYRDERVALIDICAAGDATPEIRLIAALYGVCPDCGSTEPCGHGES